MSRRGAIISVKNNAVLTGTAFVSHETKNWSSNLIVTQPLDNTLQGDTLRKEGSLMNRSAKKCLYWAIPLIVVGTAVGVITPDFVGRYITFTTGNADLVAYAFLGLLTSGFRYAAVAVGAALIAAAVVINVLQKDSSSA